MKPLLPAVLVLAAVAAAQSFTTSPQTYARQEGPGANTWPWTGPFRYQQVYTDLTGAVRVVSGLAWRRNYDQFANTAAAPRTLDMEVLLCDSSFAGWSTTFASNYAGTPAIVFTRKPVNAPDFRTTVTQRPAPFDFAILFDTPYVYLGINDLLYEIAMFTSSATGSYYCDAPVYLSAPTLSWGTYTSQGSGCMTSNGDFLARSLFTNTFSTGLVSFAFDVVRGPSAASAAMLVGLVPFNLPIPGLCTNLYTDGLVSLPFTTNATGAGAPAAIPIAWSPGLATLVLTAQAAAVDPSQPFVPIAASQGLRCEVPPPSLPLAKGARLWSQGNPTGLTGTSSTDGWLVTQFRH